MTKAELFNSLDELSLPDNIINKLYAPKWKFWKKNHYIKANEVFPMFQEYLSTRTGKSNKELRQNAYSVIAKLLLYNMTMEYCQYLINCLRIETDKYVLDSMLTSISKFKLSNDIDVSPIVECSRSNEWLVRRSALIALSMSNTDASRSAVRYWVQQSDEQKYKYELIFAIAALGCIGELCDINLLEKHTNSRIRDIKDASNYAIRNINSRLANN